MSEAYVDMLGHVGPWTEEDYFALPDDDLRIELLDGALLVNPPPGGPHQRLSSRLWQALDAATPPGLEVLAAIGVRTAPGSILIPDLAVVTNPGADGRLWEARDVALVVEISGPDSVVRDRAIKPALYAPAAIQHYLRIELGKPGPTAVLSRLVEGTYRQVGDRVPPGTLLRLTEPVAVDLDLAQLARTVRPDR